MLIQYKYKVMEPFVVKDGTILKIKKWTKVGHEGMPFGMKCYKPSRRKWDYVDYTGTSHLGNIEQCQSTKELVGRGWLVYIDSRRIWK